MSGNPHQPPDSESSEYDRSCFEAYFNQVYQTALEWKTDLDTAADNVIIQLAGASYADMCRNPDSIHRYFSEPDARKREAALRFVIHHLHAASAFQTYFRDLVLSDPSLRVRVVALRGIAEYAIAQKDRGALAFLAKLVHDLELPNEMRLASYRALVYGSGQLLTLTRSLMTLRFPDDIDWALVDGFLASPSV